MEGEQMSHDNQSSVSRRDLMRGAALGGVILLAGKSVLAQDVAPSTAPLRFVHMTDMHIQPERAAGEGYAAALDSLKKLDPQPAFIITGGDHIMDAFEQGPDRAKLQWDLYERTLTQNTRLKTYPAIGNHDVYAWGEKQKGIALDSAGYGKAMALERLKLNKTYYSFDHGAWHFVVLDNISRRDFGYFGEFDPEQTEWLKADLEASKAKPICITTHIPLICACAIFDGNRFKDNAYNVPDHLVHRDVRPLLPLLRQNNVKLCLSGHIHMIDLVEYTGIKFLCNGAVSGNWWKGNNPRYVEGYAVIDVWPDGTSMHQHVTYGWTARA
jgi:3',5'-cyclic AMP phosphodiesterase CpdA